jgi:hypothetical protein
VNRKDTELALGPATGRTGGRRESESPRAAPAHRPPLCLCVSAVNLLPAPPRSPLGMGSIAHSATISVHPRPSAAPQPSGLAKRSPLGVDSSARIRPA